MSEELKEDLIELGLQRYVSALFNAGYDDWDIIGDMTESDFDALDIRLGDRRKLQREIARRQLWPENSPLPTPDELREFTLSLQDNAAGETKNGYFQHHVPETIESDRVTSEIERRPARVESPPGIQNEEAPGSIAETSQSSDTIPFLELDPVITDEYNAIETDAPSHLPILATDFNDDPTPRAAENRAVSLALPN